jgi:multidrug efflux pump
VIASADGIDYIESSSAQSVSTITVHLKLNYNTNDALTQIQSKVAEVRNDLPPEAQAPVIQVQTADAQFAAMYLGFSSKDLDQNQISDYLVRVVQPRLSAVAGVQKADVLGGRTFAMRIWLKPDQMAAHGLSASEVWATLSQNNSLSALGATKGTMTYVNLVANTDLKSPEEFRSMVVQQKGNDIVRLGDIADVSLGAEDYNTEVKFNGETATFMGIWVLPTANALEVIKNVRAAVKDLEAELPVGMKVGLPYDSTEYIQQSIHEVLKTLTETLLIVVLVIFLFLGSVRGLIIPVIAIPISLIGAVFLMNVAGFTINLLTLLAVVLSVGLVVDDAIVMVENVERHVHSGEPPFQAAIHAARELLGPIIAMTITLAAVYTPVALPGGLARALSPMLGSRLLRQGDSEKGFAGFVNHQFDLIRQNYMRVLGGTLQNRNVVLVLWVLVTLLIFPFYMFAQRELAPSEDQSVVFGIVQAAPNATIDQTTMFAKGIYEAFHRIPEAKNIFQITTPGGGFAGMVTKPWNERKKSIAQLQGEVAAGFAQVPGVRGIALTPPSLPGGSGFPVDMVIMSTAGPEQLLGIANEVVGKAYASGKFWFVDTDLKYDQPQTEIVFDRDKVRTLGVDMSQVGADLSRLLGGNFVNRFSVQGRSYKVIPQIKRAERLTAEQLQSVYVTGPGGKLVPLSTFATLNTTTQPRELKRFQQLNAVRIQAVIPPQMPLDEALTFLETNARQILPRGYSIDFAGESRQLRTEGGKFLGVFALSGILIFLVLAAQFESFRDPFVILLGSAPLALAGSLMFMFLGFTSFNIYSQVGLITLMGLVAKNGILIVEFANHLQERGLDKARAVVEAAGTRLRPILMTTAATVFGHVPLILARGPGAAARNSIGISLVTGMIVGTAFTLFVVPAIYTLVAKSHQREEALEETEDLTAVAEGAVGH